jgi:enterochelin esterase-like enzyme
MAQEQNENLHLIAPFHSDQLDNDRGVAVWLPPSYNGSPERRYPVLYLQDGLSVFDCDPRSGDLKAGVDSWVTKLSERGMMTEIVVVAIDSVTGRDQEYSPAVRGEQYGEFLVTGLKPFIDHNYRTLTEPRNTAIGGWSLGALISLYLAWQRPDVFGKAACLSTCFFDCPTDSDGDMVMRTYNEMIHASDFDPDLRLYFDYGTDENVDEDISQPENIEQTLRLTKTLRENLLIPEVDFTFHVEKGGKHLMQDWRRRFYRPLTYLFAPADQSRSD